MKIWRRTTLAAVAATCMVAVFTIVSAPAHAYGVENNYASTSKISATIGPNSWSTSTYTENTFAQNYVTVGALGGACSPDCYWWEGITSGDGTLLYDSPAYFSGNQEVDSPVEYWNGHVYTWVAVAPWTSMSNISVDTATCC
jgi:hypothetical protein